ncbi:MAG: C4-type zinc ribbon domain-containing protein [Actinomycetota bacterium]|nr:C4-type zinc ribbon domain-containing protein [Actinomycetota bacterium]MDD5667123.1 C4-type zinc ribbon domain-containing protein [Actinomycetota bacterium]
MNELEALFRVQELDTRVMELRNQEEHHALKGELEELEQRSVALQAEIEEAEASLEESRKKQRAIEDKVQGVDEKLAREEGKLYDGKVTNPKELRGLEAEVRSLKRKKDELETEELEEMERLDELKGALDGLRADLEALRAEAGEKRAALDREVAEIGAELAELEKERGAACSQVSEEVLELYDELLESRHHLAVVKVVDGVCQGCRVELPGIEYDRFLKSESVFTCTNCGRILVK